MTEPLDLFADDGTADAPPAPDLDTSRAQAAGCTRCELHHDTTGTVFGSGPPEARLVMVGEQPGDQEDRQGAPFVGPAGRLLDEALDGAGSPAMTPTSTNAVKHFNFRYQGKRRIHETPKAGTSRPAGRGSTPSWPWCGPRCC